MTRREKRKLFRESVERFAKVRQYMGCDDCDKRTEADEASMAVRSNMKELHAIGDSDYICAVFHRYGITQ